MAISLSNHEDRIKKLESKVTNGNMKLLYSGVTSSGFTLNTNCHNFDYLIIVTYDDENYNTLPIIAKTSTSSFLARLQLADICHLRLRFESNGTAVTCLEAWRKYRTHSEIGLKLYYSFSYNIIYKILLRKISRLVKKLHFNLFEISSRRGGVNYEY